MLGGSIALFSSSPLHFLPFSLEVTKKKRLLKSGKVTLPYRRANTPRRSFLFLPRAPLFRKHGTQVPSGGTF